MCFKLFFIKKPIADRQSDPLLSVADTLSRPLKHLYKYHPDVQASIPCIHGLSVYVKVVPETRMNLVEFPPTGRSCARESPCMSARGT